MRLLLAFGALVTHVNAYFLIGANSILTTERSDPIVNPGAVASHVHTVVGGSNFRINTNTAALRQSQCSSVPIKQDKSAYWFPTLYFQWNNGSFSSLEGGVVIYYLFSDKAGTTTAFPDDFRMISGDPALRTYDASSKAQQAITFLCLDFNGKSTRYNELPPTSCPSGIRAQINFPSCWDGKNLDAPDHKSHVAFLSGGPDSGTCSDPKYPITLPRIFLEVYWGSVEFDKLRGQALNPSQPFVFANGDPTGYGYHADFFNGWDSGVLQKVVDNCHCNPFGDPTCCANAGLFDLTKDKCRNTKTWDEQVTGTIPKLPGNNPVQPAGKRATMYPNNYVPPLLNPIYTYTGDTAPAQGSVVAPAKTLSAGSVAAAAKPAVPSPVISPSVVANPDPPKVLPNSPSPSPSPSPIPSPPKIEQPGGDGRDHNCPVKKKSQHNKRRLRRSLDSGDFSVAF